VIDLDGSQLASLAPRQECLGELDAKYLLDALMR
jgi:hypothetical protein